MLELNKTYNEDCIDTMKLIGDKEVDLVITSPPYNMNLRIMKGKYVSRQVIKEEFTTKYNGFSDNLPIEDFYELHSFILKELIRISNIVFYNIQIVTGSKRAFFKMIGDFSDNLKEIIVWDKINSQPSMHSGVLNSQHELILVFESENLAISREYKKCNFDRGTVSNVWNIKRCKKLVKDHGAVFPEELVETILKNFSKDNDIVYDPFMGTGTVARVCRNMNRNFIGSEISKYYCDVANSTCK